MIKRSPAAQAVVNAYAKCVSEWFKLTETEKSSSHYHASGLAASLRAVADQVVPWRPEPTEDSVGPTIDYGYAWALFSSANDIRQELIAIADELETHQ